MFFYLSGFLLSQGNQGKSGNLKIGQGKSGNSMDVREKSGNFISSCDKKENDSFWGYLLVLKMYLLITSCLSFEKKKHQRKHSFKIAGLLIQHLIHGWKK